MSVNGSDSKHVDLEFEDPTSISARKIRNPDASMPRVEKKEKSFPSSNRD
jgi:hypothetical protein